MKKLVKTPDLNTRIGKYFVAKSKGLNKSEAQVVAGFPDTTHATRIEKTETYKAIEKAHYKDVILQKISLEEIADEQVKVILQDKDLSAKNKGIEMALDRVEPEKGHSETPDRVLIILR